MFKAVVFDIDGTLTRDISWNRFTIGLGGSVERHDEIYGMWKKGELTLTESNKLCLENWSKEGKANKKDIEDILKAIPIREDAKETVQYLEEKGYKICMITGSFDMYAEIVGQELGISEWYAISKLVWDSKDNLIDVETVTKDKERKVEFFNEFCKRNSLKPEECVAVGDSSNDILLFQITGNGVAVRTEFEAKELEAIAWKVVNNLIELKNIL
jgi:phosphoserine phosphatase